MYDLFHVKLNILKNWKFYFLLFCQLVLCFTLILIGFDENIKHQQRMDIYALENQKQLVTLNTNNYMFKVNNIIQIFDDDSLLVGSVYYFNFLDSNNKFQTIKIVQANQQFYKEYFNFIPENNYYYLYKNHDIDIKQIDFLDLKLKLFETNNINIPLNQFENGDINLINTIFLVNNPNLQLDLINNFIKIKDDNVTKYKMDQLSQQLNIDLKAYDLLAEFNKGSDSQSAFVRLFNFVSIIALIIVIFGTGAAILVFVSKRRNKNKIQYLLGASKNRLLFQLFLEIFIIMLIALIMSILLAIILEPLLSSVYYLIEFKTINCLKLLLICCVFSFIITILVSFGFSNNIRE